MREAKHHLADARTRAFRTFTGLRSTPPLRAAKARASMKPGLGCAGAYYTAVEYAPIRRLYRVGRFPRDRY
jgi:hypothetical protein